MKVLWMVAPQIDYGPGGAIEIAGVSDLWKKWLAMAKDYDELWLSLEMHPADHLIFASVHPWRKPGQKITFQGKDLWLYITHCVNGSFGAMLSAEFQALTFAKTFHFGKDKMEEPTCFFSRTEIDKLSVIDETSIDVIGVNHSPIFRPSLDHLKALGWKVNFRNKLSSFPLVNDEDKINS